MSSINKKPYYRERRSSVAIWVGAVALAVSASAARGQNIASGEHPLHAELEHRSDGSVLVTVPMGTWPLQQAIARIRREYGWVVDYEEGIPTPAVLAKDQSGKAMIRSRSLSLIMPDSNTGTMIEVQSRLQTILSQLNTSDFPPYRVIHTSGIRFDIVPAVGSEGVILDTPIVLAQGTRSINETIDKILSEVQLKTGYSVVRGGLADAELDRMQVTIGGPEPLSARVLLSRSLETAHNERVWLLIYDPQMKEFHFGIQPAVWVTTTPSGQQKVKAITHPN